MLFIAEAEAKAQSPVLRTLANDPMQPHRNNPMQIHHGNNPIPIPPINPPQPGGAGEEKSKISDDDKYLKSIPPGYRFRPSEKELIVEYLMKKINNEVLPPNRINTVRLYDFSPEDLAESFKAIGENEWYFFTPRERKYKNGVRPDRAARDGFWKATGADRPIKHNGEEIGFQKALVFCRGKPRHCIKTGWLMHEFRVKNPPALVQKTQEKSMRLDWVLCKVYKRISNARNRRKNKEVKDDTAHSCRELNIPLYPCVEGHDPLDVKREEFSRLLVESSHPISGLSSSSDGVDLLYFPGHQQGPNFSSESDSGWSNFPCPFQGHDPLYDECQGSSRLHLESSYPISDSSFSSNDVGLLSFPNHLLQGPPFASESVVNGKTIYPSHFQTMEQARCYAVNNVSESESCTLFTS